MMHRDSAASNGLAARLQALVPDASRKLNGQPARAITKYFTNLVEKELRSHGFEPVREFLLGRRPDGRRQFVDVVGLRDGHVAVAVEIDKGNKNASLGKLLRAGSQGAQAVWLRWGTPHRLPSAMGNLIPASICLVEAPIVYAHTPRRRRTAPRKHL